MTNTPLNDGTQRSGFSGLSIYLRLLEYVKQQKALLFAAIAGLAIVALTNLAFTALLIPLIDKAFAQENAQPMAWIPFAIGAIFIARSAGSFLGLYYIGSVGQHIVKVLRAQMHEKLLYSPAEYFDRASAGAILAKFSFDVERVTWAASKSIPIIVRDTLTVISLLAWMLYLSWKLTLILFIAAPLVYLAVGAATRRFRKLSRRIQTSIGDITACVEQAISGHHIVKLFTAEQNQLDRFESVNEKTRRNQTRFVAAKAINTPLVQLILGIAFALIIYVAFLPAVKADLTPGRFASFVAAVMGLLNAARKLTMINQILQSGIAASESVFTLIDQRAEQDQGGVNLHDCKGEIEFENVSLTYACKSDQALRQISLRVKPHQVIALVGKSGSGKSSLIKLIARFYEADSGQIKIDGHAITDIALSSLRRNISMVSQDIVLFNDSIENNIAYAMPDKSRQEIHAAAECAHAAEFISKLPHQYQTQVGDRGVLLSGGQRQRIAIARALLKDAPILILDEATASLDSESEFHIQQALKELRKSRTTVVIAHRLSTVEKADRIYVMAQGKIVESGAHADLIKKQGVYSQLYRHQFKSAAQAVHG